MGRFRYLWEAMEFVLDRAGRPLRAPQIRDEITAELLWIRPRVGGGPVLQQVHKRVATRSDIFYKLPDKRIALEKWR